MRYSSGETSAAIMIIDTDASDRDGAETLRQYELNGAYDEMFRAVEHPRKQYRQLYNLLLSLITAGKCAASKCRATSTSRWSVRI
jgi:hypothetical protein